MKKREGEEGDKEGKKRIFNSVETDNLADSLKILSKMTDILGEFWCD